MSVSDAEMARLHHTGMDREEIAEATGCTRDEVVSRLRDLELYGPGMDPWAVENYRVYVLRERHAKRLALMVDRQPLWVKKPDGTFGQVYRQARDTGYLMLVDARTFCDLAPPDFNEDGGRGYLLGRIGHQLEVEDELSLTEEKARELGFGILSLQWSVVSPYRVECDWHGYAFNAADAEHVARHRLAEHDIDPSLLSVKPPVAPMDRHHATLPLSALVRILEAARRE